MKKLIMAIACLMTMVSVSAKNDVVEDIYGVWRSNIDKITFVICEDSIVIKTDNESVTLGKSRDFLDSKSTYCYYYDIPVLATYCHKYTFSYKRFDYDLMIITIYDNGSSPRGAIGEYRVVRQK